MTFLDLGLSASVLRAVSDAGYENPTPIQQQAIPLVLAGHDLVACAQTGTGKTAGFTLPLIDRLAAGRAKARMPRSLILEPTRELAAQVEESFTKYSKYHKLSTALLVGGVSADDQLAKLNRGVDVLIATPGRLLDLYERGAILMNDVRILVLDECDRMLDMGFIPDVEKIASLIRPDRQTLLFSATMPPEIRHLAKKFLTKPLEVHVAPPASPAKNVEQAIIKTASLGKRDALRTLMASETISSALIFCNRKRDVDILYRSLQKHGFNVGRLHGDINQSIRTETLDAFKEGKITLLVCSDVAARGIDIKGLSHVFNFDVPTHAEDYVHRIGRTGRAGLKGKAFTLATAGEKKFLDAIEALIGDPIPEKTLEGIVPQNPADAKSTDLRDNRRDGRRGSGRSRGQKPAPAPHKTPETGAVSPKTNTPPETTTPVPPPASAEAPVVQPAPPAPAHRKPEERDPQQRQRDSRRHHHGGNDRREHAQPKPAETVAPTREPASQEKPEHPVRDHNHGRTPDAGRDQNRGNRDDRGGRNRNDRNRDHSQNRSDREVRDNRGERHHRRDEDDNFPKVKGFGDNIPAFLRHPRKA
ncbi:MAG TPA: DNA helicase [Rhodospirillaceae bacterium]|nr:MAG: hypothetical protein A2018_03585 [Alphaproteobacteria bacterium GWF2_58_20]HAU29650.1 DNA helicase [Rhodospirillaceae bacterium]